MMKHVRYLMVCSLVVFGLFAGEGILPAAASGAPLSWTVVTVPDVINTPVKISLALTDSGGVRIAFINDQYELKYASCDSGCAEASNWSVALLDAAVPTSSGSFPLKLALGPDGTAHILYPGGLFESSYTSCAGSCTDPASWTATAAISCEDPYYLLSSEPFAMTLDPAGNPRIAGLGYQLLYGGCDGGCDDPLNWTCDPVIDFADLPYPVISASMDFSDPDSGEGGPHIQYHQVLTMGYASVARASCNESCTDPANWSQGGMSLFAYGDWVTPVVVDQANAAHYALASMNELKSWFYPGEAVFDNRLALSVALTSSEEPRMAMIDGDSGQVRYGSCAADCDVSGNWQLQAVAVTGLTPPFGWGNDGVFDLALDGSDLPVMAYAEDDTVKVVLSAEAPPWGAASTIRSEADSTSKGWNFLLLIALPAAFVVIRKRSAGRGKD